MFSATHHALMLPQRIRVDFGTTLAYFALLSYFTLMGSNGGQPPRAYMKSHLLTNLNFKDRRFSA